MSSLISSPKHGGAEHSGLFDNLRNPSKLARRSVIASYGRAALLLSSLIFPWCSAAVVPAGRDILAFTASKAAAERCSLKLQSLEDFSVKRKSGQNQTTRFSEEEVNSYLALYLGPKYHPCLKSLLMTFEEDRLKCVAAIDFDRLGTASTKFFPKIIGFMFSGTHTITAHGRLLSKNGNANFQLEQANFDSNALPKFLVEEIITAVGRKQNPPFDPMQPAKMPYKIERVDVHPDYILVYQ
jgi:hypothetical protein